MGEVCPHGLFEARRILVAAERVFREYGTLEFDQALLICFFAGRKRFVIWALDNSATIDRYTIADVVREGFLRLKNGQLSADWEDEWKLIFGVVPSSEKLPMSRLV